MLLLILCHIFIACNCYLAGSESASCAENGKCTCNAGYEGKTCSQCAKGISKIWRNSQYTCSGTNILVVLICLTWLSLPLGITKLCTHLHPASSTSTQLISTSTQLHPPPSSSFQPPPSYLQHSQQYLNKNIARNWAISPNLGRKIKKLSILTEN